jgi:hypothetical protein
LRCNKIRVTSLIDGDERATWIGVTLAAGDNLAAMAARSPELPLSDTAEAVGRRECNDDRNAGRPSASATRRPQRLGLLVRRESFGEALVFQPAVLGQQGRVVERGVLDL